MALRPLMSASSCYRAGTEGGTADTGPLTITGTSHYITEITEESDIETINPHIIRLPRPSLRIRLPAPIRASLPVAMANNFYVLSASPLETLPLEAAEPRTQTEEEDLFVRMSIEWKAESKEGLLFSPEATKNMPSATVKLEKARERTVQTSASEMAERAHSQPSADKNIDSQFCSAIRKHPSDLLTPPRPCSASTTEFLLDTLKDVSLQRDAITGRNSLCAIDATSTDSPITFKPLIQQDVDLQTPLPLKGKKDSQITGCRAPNGILRETTNVLASPLRKHLRGTASDNTSEMAADSTLKTPVSEAPLIDASASSRFFYMESLPSTNTGRDFQALHATTLDQDTGVGAEPQAGHAALGRDAAFRRHLRAREENTRHNQGYRTVVVQRRAAVDLYGGPQTHFRSSTRQRRILFDLNAWITAHNAPGNVSSILVDAPAPAEFKWDGPRESVDVVRRVEVGSELSFDDFVFRQVHSRVD